MNNLRLIFRDKEPTEKEKQTVRKGMIAYHATKGHIRKAKDDYFSIVLKNKKKQTVGAIVVSFRWGAMHIETLWIDESLRHQGWGTKLMEEVGKEAVKRNCHLAYTDTYSWQAPKFYERLGYTLYGKLNDFPKGNALSYYAKKLSR